ncbi:NPCBM/NEW2 domain-containing protein [Lysinibacter cavernae]|uniref:Alpha-glucosidase (Family GH31 glycosyl hydrolase) n=1 Tax=Lysinibacter cavernae TaxID=1640652 RepID=A0A7X5R013_9MICO|nr:NPCBM/NEW2 domain-containing protein [Lysinibacter cavernae]NIH53068.1 alpha-glucosidase (family GH31 glycosyl hydrolase) [Lysinibacter cavernae]
MTAAGALVVSLLPLALISSGAQAAPVPAAKTSAPKPVSPEVPLDPTGKTLGAISGVTQTGSAVTMTAERGAIRVTFLDDTSLRVEADPSGIFSDPANTPQGDVKQSANIVVGAQDFAGTTVSLANGSTIAVSTPRVTLEIDKATSQMTLKRADGSVVWAEKSPLSLSATASTQTLKSQPGEQFIGGGMQNGRSIHTGATINIARNSDWDDDGYPNAVPYYMSSNGYGVLRDTFAKGSYVFAGDPTLSHQEKRFDAFYFVGDYKQSLDGYTKLTGRPMMPPVYALEYGDADCYNRSSPSYKPSGFGDPGNMKQVTPDAAKVAQGFVDHNMPGGWMLVNDGYGCEYTQLPETTAKIAEVSGMKTGLWTERSLTNQPYEVGDAGIRMRKLDVAWVGSGYRLALTGCEAAYNGIEQNSDARGTALMVEGWAGSQRCGMQWTGDHTGNLDAVRWQVSALTGAGNSGLAFTTGDVDGIFGGSMQSYVRDLQWKTFAPALYSMSGWASTDKRPWLYGDEATEINRSYLELRQRLLPYIYTLAAESHSSGTPMMRSLALEYPNDPASYSAEANNEFLLGNDFLVAPVFTASNVRNGIYLPEGTWVDYWSGELYQGGRVLNGYSAPLDMLPVFVRAGAVVPQGIAARNSALTPEDSAITVDIYPAGTSTFTLYEDDKTTRAYQSGAASSQEFTVSAPESDAGDVSVTVGARVGEYSGKSASRPYVLDVHSGTRPDAVERDGVALDVLADRAAFDAADQGWFYDADAAGGTVHVKVGAVGSGTAAAVVLKGASAVGGSDSDALAAQVDVQLDDQVFLEGETTATVVFTNTGDQAKTEVSVEPVLPANWTLTKPVAASIARVEPGALATVTFTAKPSAGAAGGPQTVSAKATYTDAGGTLQSVEGANQIYVGYGSIAGAYNLVSTTDLATRTAGNFDGGGSSLSAEELAKQGIVPGAPVTVGTGDSAVTYTWPNVANGTPNSVQLDGQTISVGGTGTHLAILGSAASTAGVANEVKLQYTDGSTQMATFTYPNWLQPTDLKGATLAISTQGRNSATNPAGYEYGQYKYQVFQAMVRLNPVKELKSVTLPVNSAVKIFDWNVVARALPAPVTADAFVSDLAWVSATNGYGVIGKDVANKDSASSPDLPLVINTSAELKKTYTKGLGVHAPSKITYYLGGSCSTFTADVGLEDAFNGTVIFKVDVDGVKKYQGTTFKAGFPTESIAIDVTGAQYIDLIVDPIDPKAISGAHGVWGDARVTCAEPDTEPPLTTATSSVDAATTGWYTASPVVTLSATDNVLVSDTQFRLGSGEWQTYVEPFVISDGETEVWYRSTDTNGNVESEKSLGVLRVDTQRPSVEAVADPDARTVTVTASDSGSGIGAIEYSTDTGGTWQAYTEPITAPDGGIRVQVRATDVAGNISAERDAVVIAPKPTGPDPDPASILVSGKLTPGGSITVRYAGAGSAASVELWLHSTPTKLASSTADASGSGLVETAIPEATELGTHELRLVVDGQTIAQTAITVVAADDPNVTVPEPGSGGNSNGNGSGSAGSQATGSAGLARTGSTDGGWTMLAALGLVLVGLVSRRRRA